MLLTMDMLNDGGGPLSWPNADTQSPKFKEPIGALSKEQLEFWYDEVYQMCLLAVLRLEHVGRKKTFEALKSKIEKNIIKKE